MSTAAQRLGKYELQELLGKGGMAEVWKALDTQLHRYVAIKILHSNLQTDPDFVSRFIHEAQMVAALRHPNIVQIYDFQISEQTDESTTTAYMVMEYIEGDTLAHYIHETSAQHKFPSGSDIVRLFTPISLALDYAHQRGTIHRDIKPANILLDKTRTTRNSMGEPILSDFGLAKVLTAPSQTVAGMVFGTPLYISPEQVQNQPISNRTDLYALGVILYEIFTGVTPFRGEGVGVMVQHITNTPDNPQTLNPTISPALSRFLLKSISRYPEDRFASAADMIAALAVALELPVPADINDTFPLQSNTDLPTIETPSSRPMPETLYAGRVMVEEQGNIANPEMGMRADISGETVAMPDSETYLITPEKVNEDADASNLSARETIPPRVGDTLAVQPNLPVRQRQPMETPPPPVFSPPAVPERKKRRTVPIIVSVIIIVLLLGAGFGTFFLYRINHSTASTPTVFGQAYFVSSGKTQGPDAIPFSNDEFQISLNNIPDPQPGKSYYAWLLPDNTQSESAVLLLGRLSVNHGNVHLLYTANTQEVNLLASFSRFLITEESSSITPSIPTPDLTAWRYYAALPQTPAPGQQFSLLDHLRHLLADDPEIVTLGLKGGLDSWAYRNTNRIQQWATTAQSDWSTHDYTSLRHFVVAILDYLDGSTEVQQDVPPGTPLAANPTFSQIGMLEIVPGQKLPGYLFHIALHLNGVLDSPGATAYQHNLAIRINTGINNMNGWLGKVREDAVQLAHMDDTQLALSSSQTLLNDMNQQAHNAYFGQTTSSGSQLQGMSQIYVTAQRLATFNVTAHM